MMKLGAEGKRILWLKSSYNPAPFSPDRFIRSIPMASNSLHALPDNDKLRFIEPMYAAPARELANGDAWTYEAKLDSYRCLAGKDKAGVTLWSRRGKLFTQRFPEIARACEKLPPDTLIDGEVIAIDDGRVSFNALQHTRPRAYLQFLRL